MYGNCNAISFENGSQNAVSGEQSQEILPINCSSRILKPPQNPFGMAQFTYNVVCYQEVEENRGERGYFIESSRRGLHRASKGCHKAIHSPHWAGLQRNAPQTGLQSRIYLAKLLLNCLSCQLQLGLGLKTRVNQHTIAAVVIHQEIYVISKRTQNCQVNGKCHRLPIPVLLQPGTLPGA